MKNDRNLTIALEIGIGSFSLKLCNLRLTNLHSTIS